MALQAIANLVLASIPNLGASGGAVTVNAVGESCGVVGRVRIVGNAASKTISSAGGKILWLTGAVTWASGSTNLRVGIQDVDLTTGLEDGTFDVLADLVPGTETLTASTLTITAMESGTKTLSDGDLIAIVVEMTARGGADSVAVTITTTSLFNPVTAVGFPYGTTDTGSLAKTSGSMLWAFVVFDDGTVGWIESSAPCLLASTSLAVNSGSSPDEYIGTFTAAFKMQVSGIGVVLSGIATTDSFEVILYADPYGTPVATVTLTPDPDVVSAAGVTGSVHLFSITPTTIAAGATVGIAVRPTTVNSINYHYLDASSSAVAAIMKAALPLASIKVAARTNQTGAFAEVAAQQIPLIALDVSALDDGVGSTTVIETSMPMVVLPRGYARY